MFKVPDYSTICEYCSHLISKKDRRCKAFKKIPLNIWVGLHDHRSPYFGDDGIRYSPAYDQEEVGDNIGDIAVAVPFFSVICRRCKHLTGPRECKAYPEMIPLEIWIGQDDHRSAYPGDNGIRYESKS